MAETKNNMAPPAAAAEISPLQMDVSVRLVEPKDNLLGFASVVLNKSIVIDDISIVRSNNGIFVGMPSKPDPTKPSGYKQVARPIGAFRTQLSEVVREAYHAQVEKVQAYALAHGEHSKAPEQGKSSIKKDIADGKKQADRDNAARVGQGSPQARERQPSQEQTTPGNR